MIRSTLRRRIATPLAALLALAAAGCEAASVGGPSLTGNDDPNATLFVAQGAPPITVMDALFEGKVTRDEQGCLRLESHDQHTVIWPYGSALQAQDGDLHVRIAGGQSAGRVGGTFRLGGGEVGQLYEEALGISAETRALVETRCPGRYWIVGDVLID